MKSTQQKLNGVYLLEPTIHKDSRGHFYVPYNKTQFDNIIGNKVDFIQDNESQSTFGVLRGLHYQNPPFAQAKLVRVTKGEVLDIIVDLRSNSATFGQSMTFLISDSNKRQLFVPRGFAHGFVVLSNYAVFNYKVDNIYNPESDSGIIWNDKSLDLNWQIAEQNLSLSAKDRQLQTFEEYKLSPDFQ